MYQRLLLNFFNEYFLKPNCSYNFTMLSAAEPVRFFFAVEQFLQGIFALDGAFKMFYKFVGNMECAFFFIVILFKDRFTDPQFKTLFYRSMKKMALLFFIEEIIDGCHHYACKDNKKYCCIAKRFRIDDPLNKIFPEKAVHGCEYSCS
jgi:hypothetical protein